MTNQHGLRLEVGTEVPWVLSGSGADRYLFVNDYLGYLADRNYSPRTLRAYGYDLLAFCRWLDTVDVDLASVTTDTVLDFMRYCRQTPIAGRPANVVSMTGKRLDRYASTTINHRLAALTGLFTFRTLLNPSCAIRSPLGARPGESAPKNATDYSDTWSGRNDGQPYVCANRAGCPGRWIAAKPRSCCRVCERGGTAP